MPRKPERELGHGGRLLVEIDAFGRALSSTKGHPVAPPKSPSHYARPRSLSAGKSYFGKARWKPRAPKRHPQPPLTPVQKQKKPSSLSSIWNWKPLRALSHIGHSRFECLFTLHVHSVEGLPPSFNNAALCVHWKLHAAEVGLRTRPALISHGVAEFEEMLEQRCAVYGSRGGGPRGAAKYEARQYVLYPAVVGAPGVDLGEHRVDFTRLLPRTMEELEKEASGRWRTTVKLSGKASGASLYVSFGFSLLDGQDMVASGGNGKASETLSSEPDGTAGGFDERSRSRRVGSIPTPNRESNGRSRLRSRSVEDIKIVHEVGAVHRNCDECEQKNLVHNSKTASKDLSQQEKLEAEFDGPEFTAIEQGLELVAKEGIGTRDDSKGRVEPRKADKGDKHGVEDNVVENDLLVAETIMEELESAFQSLSTFESVGLEPQKAEVGVPAQMSYEEIKSNYKIEKANRSLSLDDVAESIASEFLSMLGVEHDPFGLSSDSDPESPRDCLWKQFKRESFSNRESIFGVDMEKGEEFFRKHCSERFDLPSVVHAAETEHQKTSHTMKRKTGARTLEDAETEALMHEWGLNETAFQNSPPGSAGGFGSPIELPPDDTCDLPSPGDGLGPVVQTKNGGFLRSMNPSLFRDSQNNGSLIMQVSCPLVVPAEMGSSIMEILQHLASVGVEKLSMQASKLMPLEDITGKTMQQVAWEACERQAFIQHFKAESVPELGRNAAGEGKMGKLSNPHLFDYVSQEELAPLAMKEIEVLTIEGLRIQSGMSDEDATLSISPQSVCDISALEGKGAKICRSLGLEGAAALKLLDVKDGTDDIDGLLNLSITLDEWTNLDSGITDEEDQISDRTVRILAAHHASLVGLVTGMWENKRTGRRHSGRRWGLFGSNLTVAMMVQLRDPLRNNEPVGVPMLAFIHVERIFIPSKPKIYGIVSDNGNNKQHEEPRMKLESPRQEEKEGEELIPQFKISEVHIAGLKTDPGQKKFWDSAMQRQSISQWLHANGMGKSSEQPFVMSKTITKPLQGTTELLATTGQSADMLWSISSRNHATETEWKQLSMLKPHIRNPNIIFPNETVRL